ncbi:MAG: glycosyltransferase 61 family protein [Pseudomonadota bacterium]
MAASKHISGRAPNPDPLKEPSPAGGWSEQVSRYDAAIVVPGSGQGLVQEAGVYTSDKDFIPEAVLWRGQPLMVPTNPVLDAKSYLGGRHIWGGVMLNHFGHYLTESLNRLWAYPDLASEVDGLVFVHKRNGELSDFNIEFLKLLGIDLPITLIKEPTLIEHLIIPGQGFGLGAISYGTDRYNQFVCENFAPNIPANGPEKIYASRSQLPARKGGAIGETLLEKLLEQDGYTIIHPQAHPLDEQIGFYKAAQKIIGLDGSALHLAGFCIDAATDVAMILRRSSGVALNIRNQLHGITGKQPAVINAIEYDWILEGRGRADRFSIGQMDFPLLGQRLYEVGMLDTKPDWPALTEDLVADEIETLSDATKFTYERRMTRARLQTLRQERRAARSEAQ